MNRFSLLVALFCLASVQVHAGPSSMVAFDKPTLDILSSADPANGKEEAEICATCHGENGVALLHQAANLAGQRASYIYKQLKDFKDGHRIEHEMNRFARRLNDKSIADLAVWYASLPLPAYSKPDAISDNIRKLVYKGDPERLLKSCSSCHNRDGLGGQFSHPQIAGQTREYLVQSLHDFRDGSRENDVWSRMRVVAEALTDEEIEGLADFYSNAQ